MKIINYLFVFRHKVFYFTLKICRVDQLLVSKSKFPLISMVGYHPEAEDTGDHQPPARRQRLDPDLEIRHRREEDRRDIANWRRYERARSPQILTRGPIHYHHDGAGLLQDEDGNGLFVAAPELPGHFTNDTVEQEEEDRARAVSPDSSYGEMHDLGPDVTDIPELIPGSSRESSVDQRPPHPVNRQFQPSSSSSGDRGGALLVAEAQRRLDDEEEHRLDNISEPPEEARQRRRQRFLAEGRDEILLERDEARWRQLLDLRV